MQSEKETVLALLRFYAERLYPTPGLRPGDNPQGGAYRTGEHDVLMSLINVISDHDTVDDALSAVRSRYV